MHYPAFFDQAPAITVHDGLAEMLGACDDGLITYRYPDAVRLAGHSCPTVAFAYLMARRALQILFPEQVPERGMLKVAFSAPLDEGVTGVSASVIGLITGAAGPGGFKGIGGHFGRQNLLQFDAPGRAGLCVARTDNGAALQLKPCPQAVPADPRCGALLAAILAGTASQEEARAFSRLWQERVRKILIDHADDPALMIVTTHTN